MKITFDPGKDKANIEKHGISLSHAADLQILAFIEDRHNDYGETRYWLWGWSTIMPIA